VVSTSSNGGNLARTAETLASAARCDQAARVPGDLRGQALTAYVQALSGLRDELAVSPHLSPLGAELEARGGVAPGDPALAAWLVRTALAAGNRELAARAAGAAQALAAAYPGCPALAAAAAHSRGLACGDPADPACGDPADLAEAAARHPDPWARASAAEDLGVLYTRQGRWQQAIHQLQEALGGYAQAGADRDQARVRRRLRRLGIRRRHWSTSPARPVTGWDSLTGTEQAVAGLVAQGLSNNQVAARMYISTHTVAHHLRQAFHKLSIASRVELTRVVIEQKAGATPFTRAETQPVRKK
jgi:DNA-binding CsgD family transcriptional regulator